MNKILIKAGDPKQRHNILTHGHTKKSNTLHKIKRRTPPVVFLKTHKTGSSTVQNLLFRMGEKEGATFAFPAHMYHFSYPDKYADETPGL